MPHGRPTGLAKPPQMPSCCMCWVVRVFWLPCNFSNFSNFSNRRLSLVIFHPGWVIWGVSCDEELYVLQKERIIDDAVIEDEEMHVSSDLHVL
jgi:hypothetical protein